MRSRSTSSSCQRDRCVESHKNTLISLNHNPAWPGRPAVRATRPPELSTVMGGACRGRTRTAACHRGARCVLPRRTEPARGVIFTALFDFNNVVFALRVGPI